MKFFKSPSLLPFFIMLFLGLILASCQEPIYTPKPRSYPRVDYPKKAYQSSDTNSCPFTFEYPVYCEIEQNKQFFEEAPPSDCWFDVFYPNFDGRIHFTYYPLEGSHDLERLRNDAFKLADWHNKRANYIDEVVIQKDNGVSGIAFDIDGPSASPYQFFLTDGRQHFVRGALYFNTEVRADSLAPIIDFVEEDIIYLLETFEWK